MATGDSNDILSRIQRLIPANWFNGVAPIRDAVLGGLADLAAWLYSFLYYVYAQMRIASASGPSLDLIAYDFLGLYLRRNGASDAVFRAKIKATILQERVTRAGMISALTTLTGTAPTIFEPWNAGDTGGWDSGGLGWAGTLAGTGPGGGWDAASGWDTNSSGYDLTFSSAQSSGGGGGWGATNMPAQVLITIPPVAIQGIPTVGGWDQGLGWDAAASGEWIDTDNLPGTLTDADILAAVNATKPTGVIAWVDIQ